MTLSISFLSMECRYANCHIVMLSVIFDIVMLSVIMLDPIVLSVVLLSVVAAFPSSSFFSIQNIIICFVTWGRLASAF